MDIFIYLSSFLTGGKDSICSRVAQGGKKRMAPYGMSTSYGQVDQNHGAFSRFTVNFKGTFKQVNFRLDGSEAKSPDYISVLYTDAVVLNNDIEGILVVDELY
jgi:hypothetical protein